MKVSGLLVNLPYGFFWNLYRISNRLDGVIIYVESVHDYYCMAYILPHLRFPFKLVSKNRRVKRELDELGVSASVWPSFPSVVIMARHSFHRFPVKAIKKIGLHHGPYFFKKMISAKKFNTFDIYLFSSTGGLNKACQHGVTCGLVGGYSRLDAFKDTAVIDESRRIKMHDNFSEDKKTLLFTATWDGSGQSAIDLWADKLDGLASKYNILISLHPKMSERYVQKVKQHREAIYLKQSLLYAGMLVTDFLISDTSSVMAEFCVLDKPIITFRIQKGARLTSEITEMINDISIQINHLRDLEEAIMQYEHQPGLKQSGREKWHKHIFDDTSVSHGKKAAELINQYLHTEKQ